MKECARRGDQTRGRLHAKRTRFQSSYRAQFAALRKQLFLSLAATFARRISLIILTWPY